MSITLERPVSQSQPAVKPASELRMEILENLDMVESGVIDAWRELTDNPMSSPDWLMPWWKHYRATNDHCQ